ncbi:MAG: DNA-processing protein DprA [Phycisphaerales bacterium]|nr:DNA-processing protein DprA [Phycisphaerales bacterium]
MNSTSEHARQLLRLRLTDGVGPIIARRLLDRFGSVEDILRASQRDLATVERVGASTAARIFKGLRDAEAVVEQTLERCDALDVRLIGFGEPSYPHLLAAIPDAPLVLFVQGELPVRADGGDAYAVAIVGSRSATAYGIEQAERFSAALAQAGLTIVSGGARGIDTAAHRAALRAQGRTIVVLGAGHAQPYPPENKELFAQALAAGSCLISEQPPDVAPSPELFPVRNRIISGLSLGVLIIEAPSDSGALITARLAVDEHGRDAMALPGRVDSKASDGCHQLIRKGEAALVMSPADVIEELEGAARHLYQGTLAGRAGLANVDAADGTVRPVALAGLTPTQRQLVEALASPRSVDELVRLTGLEAGQIQSDATVLELRRVIRRAGPRLERC